MHMTSKHYNLINTNQLMKFYKCKEWLSLRQEALKRDNYECQRCKKKGKQ
ncbi:HNH endonuclease, partial [Listeria monocytogenes]|nr:HNH endonuclease [Listeria monocytogenes]